MRKSLVRYLAERDKRLEQVRDQIFAEVIERMSQGLGRRTRFKLGNALREAEDSWQKEQGRGSRPPAHQPRDSYSDFGAPGDDVSPDFEQFLSGSELSLGSPESSPSTGPGGLPLVSEYPADAAVTKESNPGNSDQTEYVSLPDSAQEISSKAGDAEQASSDPIEEPQAPSDPTPPAAGPLRRPRRPKPPSKVGEPQVISTWEAARATKPDKDSGRSAGPKSRAKKPGTAAAKSKSQSKVKAKSSKR